MIYATEQVVSEIGERFGKIYRAFGGFIESGELWDECISAVRNVELMNNIIFCNDVHEIPPVLTFLRVLNVQEDLAEFEKRSIGAFWGFVFKFIFNYRNQRSVSARVNTVKTATYFYDVKGKVVIVRA
jgi:hypothetical protein